MATDGFIYPFPSIYCNFQQAFHHLFVCYSPDGAHKLEKIFNGKNVSCQLKRKLNSIRSWYMLRKKCFALLWLHSLAIDYLMEMKTVWEKLLILKMHQARNTLYAFAFHPGARVWTGQFFGAYCSAATMLLLKKLQKITRTTQWKRTLFSQLWSCLLFASLFRADLQWWILIQPQI